MAETFGMLVKRRSASFAACVTLLANFCPPGDATVAVVPRSAHLLAIRGKASQARVATSPNYTLRDLGAPGPSSVPTSFNNTGQIVGNSGKNCVVWTGRAYRTLPLSGDLTGCAAFGINDANAPTGQYEVVGSVSTRYLQNEAAFAALADASGETKATIYYYYPNSTLSAVNSNGVSLGFAAFAPADTREVSGELLFTNEGATHYFTPLQAPVPSLPPVHYLVPQYVPDSPCAFGGCLINDLNEVVGADYFSAGSKNPTLAIYKAGAPASFMVLPISSANCCGIVALNNKNQILFNANGAGQGNDPIPEIYDVTAKQMTRIPSATPDCPKATAAPIGLNNNGEMLGRSDEPCTLKYFTWDPNSGTQAVRLPAPYTNSRIYALGINDKREILVQFITVGGAYDWGLLEPISPSGTLKTRARSND